MAVNYDDKRFVEVEAEKDTALSNVETQYKDMIDESKDVYDKQIAEVNRWTEEQKKLQQEQTDFALEQIEQQKDQANKDYLKEQRGAYVDWQKESNPYGVEAEKIASAGLTGSGYSETSKVRMYTAYQNRVATAREVYNRAVLNYDNAIKDAILQNNVALAQLANDGLMKELELSLAGLQYRNDLIAEMTNKKLEVEQIYYQRWQDVLDQINTENALAEQQRQFEAEMAARAAELAEEKRQYELSLAEDRRQYDLSLAEERRQYEADMAARAAELEEEKRQFELSLAEEQRQYDESNVGSDGYVTGGGNGTGGSGGTSNYGNLVKSSSSNVGNYNLYANGLSTPYYQGAYNPDRSKYGTFDNGYQPKGISGHGKLKDSGKDVKVTTQVKYGSSAGKKLTLTQTVWKAEDGTLWVWDGTRNKYVSYGKEGGGSMSFG